MTSDGGPHPEPYSDLDPDEQMQYTAEPTWTDAVSGRMCCAGAVPGALLEAAPGGVQPVHAAVQPAAGELHVSLGEGICLQCALHSEPGQCASQLKHCYLALAALALGRPRSLHSMIAS